MSEKKERIDIHQYLAEFDDIPGTRVFTAARARQGYHLNQFAMSLMKPENRERYLADREAAFVAVGQCAPAGPRRGDLRLGKRDRQRGATQAWLHVGV